MSTFTWVPSLATSKVQPRVLANTYGDGYQQRVADGINNAPKIWDLQFNGKTTSDKNSIINFLAALNGVTAFDWTDRDGLTARWLCRSWPSSEVEPGVHNISLTFEQVFGS